MPEVEQTTTAIAIKPEEDAVVVKLRDEAMRLVSYAQGFEVTNPSDVKRATEDLSLIANIKKALEAKRKEYTEPLNGYLKDINATFKSISGPVEEADRLLRNTVIRFNRRQADLQAEAIKREELRQQLAEADAAIMRKTGEILDSPPPAPVVTAAPVTKAYTGVGTMGTRKAMKWREVDFAKVPDEYKMLDAIKIGKVVRAGVTSIPGIEIYPEDGITITAKRG